MAGLATGGRGSRGWLDEIQRAKVQVNLAHTLCLIDGGRSRALLEEAARRYDAAIEVFERLMPQEADAVRRSMRGLRIALRRAGA